MKRHLFLTVIATLAISMFVACNNGEDSDTFPLLNKRSFSLASQNLDTLYSVDKSAYTLGGMEVMSRASDTVIGDLRLSPENTSIIANGKKVGTVAYRYGRVETIDIPGLCTISRLDDIQGKRCSYKIQPYPNAAASPYYIVLIAVREAPVEVTIK